MAVQSSWVEVPQTLDDEQAAAAMKAFAEARVEYTAEVLSVPLHPKDWETRYTIRVRRDCAAAATKILAEVLELEDPADDTPFTGACPSCGTNVTGAWSCPSCDLGFHSQCDANDPMVVFLREYGGFR